MIKTTLCYIEKDGKYLMLCRNKKKNDINEGKWIGIGGKFEPGETPEICLQRKVFEETGLKLNAYQFHGIIHFISDEVNEDMYLFTASVPADAAVSCCSEGTLAWVDKKDVLSLPAWEGDRLFLEKLLSGADSMEMTLIYKNGRLIHAIDHLTAICFTGHKDFKDSVEDVYAGTIKAIEEEYGKGITTFIAGGARGFDTLAAGAVLEFRKNHNVRLILALPFRDQPKVESDWSNEETKQFYKVLDAADDVIYVNEYYQGKYHARDRFMVDNSCKVISLLRHSHSGTAYTVNYALKKGKPVIRL